MEYLLPLTHSEFLLWYRRSLLKIMKFQLIPIVDIDFESDASALDKVAARVVEGMPNYDEDYEVLIARIGDISTVPYYLFDECKPAFINISINNLDCLYPITERGKRLLYGRIDGNIKLGEPLFESYVNGYIEQQRLSLLLLGGEALVRIAGLDILKYQDAIKLFERDALSGASRSGVDEQFPLDGTLIENVMCYTRSEPMASTDTSYFLDFGVIVKKLYLYNDDIMGSLDKYRSRLKKNNDSSRSKNKDNVANKSVTFYDLLDKVSDVLAEFDDALKVKLSGVSIIIFLKLQSELYQYEDLDKTSFKELVATYPMALERDIANALWLVGVRFGFECFCANYYEAMQPEFLLEF
jgi:hypothetical protein